MNEITIDGRTIGEGRPTFVIAEIGVNHDGSASRALELVRHARNAGADAVKLQLFSASRLVHRSAHAAGYQTANCGATDQASLLRQYELSPDDFARIVGATRDAGLVPIATPFSIEDVDAIEHLDLPAIKIASPDLVNKPLLERCVGAGRPLLVSSGAATTDEIDDCRAWMRAWHARLALLHCVSAYPTPPADARLGWIDALRRRYDVPIGYSDHTAEPLAGALAVAAGACIVEKHLTWNRAAREPDHAASADPAQFASYVGSIRAAEVLRGVAGTSREVLALEADVRRLSRQSVVVARDVRAGATIARGDLIVQRPGAPGILAAQIDAVAGRAARCDLVAGTILQWDMLADAA